MKIPAVVDFPLFRTPNCDLGTFRAALPRRYSRGVPHLQTSIAVSTPESVQPSAIFALKRGNWPPVGFNCSLQKCPRHAGSMHELNTTCNFWNYLSLKLHPVLIINLYGMPLLARAGISKIPCNLTFYLMPTLLVFANCKRFIALRKQ